MLILGTSQLRCREYFVLLCTCLYTLSMFQSHLSIYERVWKRTGRIYGPDSSVKLHQPNADEGNLLISALNSMLFVRCEVFSCPKPKKIPGQK